MEDTLGDDHSIGEAVKVLYVPDDPVRRADCRGVSAVVALPADTLSGLGGFLAYVGFWAGAFTHLVRDSYFS